MTSLQQCFQSVWYLLSLGCLETTFFDTNSGDIGGDDISAIVHTKLPGRRGDLVMSSAVPVQSDFQF